MHFEEKHTLREYTMAENAPSASQRPLEKNGTMQLSGIICLVLSQHQEEIYYLYMQYTCT